MSVNGEDFSEPVYWLNKVNLKTYTDRTGAQLAALSGVQLGLIYRCNSTGNGFTLNNFYMRNDNDTSWITVFAAAGWQEVFADARKGDGVFFAAYYPKKEQFVNTTQSGGSLTNDDTGGGVNIETNTTTGGGAGLCFQAGSAKVDWSKPVVMRFKMQFDDARQVTARIGMHLNTFTVPNGTNKGFGLEIDQVPNTDTFWSIISADGSAKSTLLTSNNPVSSSNTFRYMLFYTPNVDIKMYVNGGLIATKTTNLPNTGSHTSTNVFTVSDITRHANNKDIDLRSLVLAFHNGDAY